MPDKHFLATDLRNSRTKNTQAVLYDRYKQLQLTRNKNKLIIFGTILMSVFTLQTIYSLIFPDIYSISHELILLGVVTIFFTSFLAIMKLRKKSFKKWRLILDTCIFVDLLISMIYFQTLNIVAVQSPDQPDQNHFILAIHELFRFTCMLLALFLLIDTWWIRSLLFAVTFLINTGSVIYWGPKDHAIIGDFVFFSVLATLGACFFSYCWHLNEVETFKEIDNLLKKDAVWKLIVDCLPVSVAVVNLDSKFLFNNFSFKNLFQEPIESTPAHNLSETNTLKTFKDLFKRVRLKSFKDPKLLLNELRRDESKDASLISQDMSSLPLRQSKPNKKKPSLYVQSNVEITLWEYIEELFEEFSREEINKIYEEEEEEKLKLITVNGVLDEKISLEISFGFLMFNGEPGIIYFLNDTTTSERIAKLEGNSQFKSILFNSLSHEFRTPMNGSMILLREMSKDHSIAKEIQQNYIRPIVLNLKRLLLMIHSMGDYSSITQNLAIKLNCKPFNIKKFLHRIMKVINYETEKKRLHLQLEIDESTPIHLNSDKERLGRVLLSLLENAIKFTFEGSVKLIVKPGSFWKKINNNPGSISIGQLELHSETPKSASDLLDAIFIIEDTGIGMTESQLTNLQRILRQGEFEQKVSTNSTGASLGLTLANELAKALGQELVFFSEDGKGTRVSFRVVSQKLSGSTLLDLDFREKRFRTMTSDISCNNANSELLNPNKTDLYDFNMKKSRQSPTLTRVPQNSMQYPCKDAQTTTSPHKWPEIIIEESKECDCPQILIVDDDPFNVDSVKTILTKVGVRVAEAFNGKIAVDMTLKINNHHKNNCQDKVGGLKLVLMDVNMPVMDGCKATSLIRAMITQEEIAQLIIIGCTAYDKPEVNRACIEAGMDDVEIKPLKLEKLKKLWAALQKFKLKPF